MAINTWNEMERPDYDAILRKREEAQRRTEERIRLENEAMAFRRRQELDLMLEESRNQDWYAEAMAAQERARKAKADQELRQQIKTELLIAEVAAETSDALE